MVSSTTTPPAGAQKRTNESNETNISIGEEAKNTRIDFKLVKPYYPPEVTDFFAYVNPGFFEGCVMKYVIRCEHESRKDNKLEDLEKAITYVNMIGKPTIMAEKRVYVNRLELPRDWQKDAINALLMGDLGTCITILWCMRNLAAGGSVKSRVDEDVLGYLSVTHTDVEEAIYPYRDESV